MEKYCRNVDARGLQVCLSQSTPRIQEVQITLVMLSANSLIISSSSGR